MKTITDIINELKAEGVSVTRQSMWTLIKKKNIKITQHANLILLDEPEAKSIFDYYKIKKGK